MGLFEWVQDKARKAAYLESAKGTIEQRVDSSFAEGIENEEADILAADLGPVSLDDIKKDEDIAFLAGEIAKKESKSINWLDFGAGPLIRKTYCFTALDKLADSRLAKAMSESPSFKGLMEGDYFLLTILQDKFEFEHDWVDERFKDKKFIFPFLFLSQVDYWFPIPLQNLAYGYNITPRMMEIFQGEPNEERTLPEDAGVLDKLAVNFPDDVIDFYRQMLPKGEWIKRSRVGMSLDNEFTLVKVPGKINSLPSVELLFTALYYRKIDPEKLFEFLNSLDERSTKCYVEETIRQIGKRAESCRGESKEGMSAGGIMVEVPATVEMKHIGEERIATDDGLELVIEDHTEFKATIHFPDFVDSSKLPDPHVDSLVHFVRYSLNQVLDAVPAEKFDPHRIFEWVRKNSPCKDPMPVLRRVPAKNIGDVDFRAAMEYYDEWMREDYRIGMDYGIDEENERIVRINAEGFFSSLTEFLIMCPKSQFDPEFVSRYFPCCFGWDSDLGNADAKNLGKLAKIAKSGKISFSRIRELYDTAMAEGGTYLESVIKSLPDLAAEYPEEALKRFEELHERVFVWSMDNEQFYDPRSTDLEEIIKQNLKLSKAMRESLKKTIGQNSKKPEFSALKQRYLRAYLCTEANTARLEKIEKIYNQENREKPVPSDEKISIFVEGHYRHFNSAERAELTDILIDRYRFAREHSEYLLKGGFSSQSIIDMSNDVSKFASLKQNEREEMVYSLRENLVDSKHFISGQKGDVLELDDGMSMLIIENLKKRLPGQRYATELYKAMSGKSHAPWEKGSKGHRAAMLNMFYWGILHKELKQAAEKAEIKFPDVAYQTLTGVPHYAAIKIPLPETSMSVYRRAMQPIPDSFISRSGRIIEAFNEMAKKSKKCIISGDNKIVENMCNGYVHDFATAGEGLEVEDITYGLVEPKLGIPLIKTKDYIRAYTTMRCMHDKEFAGEVLKGKEDEMLAMADAATLKALSIYASCTRKRVKQMESGEIMPRRNYFIKAMQYMLNNGDFTVVGAA